MRCAIEIFRVGSAAWIVVSNDAISMGVEIYEIDAHRCTECVGHFDQPQCVQLCPVACIPVNPSYVETEQQLLAKYRRLQQLPMGDGGAPLALPLPLR